MASRSYSLYDELWMYKSDSDGFFSTTVVYRYSDTSYSSTVSCVDLNYNYGLRITWIGGRRHVVYTCHKRLVHAIETCVILCSQVMAGFANHVGLSFLMCKSDSDGFFQPQLV